MHNSCSHLRPSRRVCLNCFPWRVLALALAMIFLAEHVRAQGAATAARQLAPGVLTTIRPDLEPDDTVSTHDLVEVRSNRDLQWSPEYMAQSDTLYGMSTGVKFRREIWGLEFAFKPLRMIEIDVPVPGGGRERKLVSYLVYRVRNTGQTLEPTAGEGGVFAAKPGSGEPVQFFPQFVLESHDRAANGDRVSKAYLDRVIPAAVEAIRKREMRGGKLLNSVEMAQQPLPVAADRVDRGVWGVATWTDVDPRIDFFSVYVGGLTNAYRWEDVPGAYRPGDPPGRGRQFARKMLQLNFWRPGDELLQTEQEVRYGVPMGKADLYDVREGVAYNWIYR
jgi:hypothetical protein